MNLVRASVFCSLFVLLTSTAFAKTNGAQPDHPGLTPDDALLVADVHAMHGDYYVEAGNLVATELLPDDTSGSPHQKWKAQLSDGSIITVVYNSDLGARVPIKVGDRFSVGGKFLWLGHSGMIHWVHDDPKGTRPDGYVYFNGVVYGDTDHEDGKK